MRCRWNCCSRRTLPGSAVVCLGLLFCLAIPTSALGQLDDLTPSTDREELYREIGEQYEAIAPLVGLLKKVVRVVKPTVVHIEATKRELGDEVDEAGSGVIVKYKGSYYVLTNRHVVTSSDVSRIEIRLADGRKIHPTKEWEDLQTDVAVLAIAAENLEHARIGNSQDIDIGDFVMAVGSPFGLSHSVTLGIISATGRNSLKIGSELKYQNFFQTDAAINPGNSGGPLLNLRGEVIGINTAIASSSGGNEGIGFTIPINMVTFVATQLIENGYVSRAQLGVKLDSNYTPEEARRVGLVSFRGARVSEVLPGTPAELANIRTGDIILEFDGEVISDDVHLINKVGFTPVNKEVEMWVLRGSQKLRLTTRVRVAQ